MITNPLKQKNIHTYIPIRISCVLENLSDFNNPQIHGVRDYCNTVGILFSTRPFNSMTNADDMNYVEKLPAFHIYEGASYIKTMYLDTNPTKVIRETVEDWNSKKKSGVFRFFRRLIQSK